METANRIIKVICENSIEWKDALKELMEVSNGCSHDQIMKAVNLLYQMKEAN